MENFRSDHQTGFSGVVFDIANRIPEMSRIQGAAEESFLPEMAVEALFAMEEGRPDQLWITPWHGRLRP